jgi:flagellar hook assembly protein FlgD/subtilase family serine protease
MNAFRRLHRVSVAGACFCLVLFSVSPATPCSLDHHAVARQLQDAAGKQAVPLAEGQWFDDVYVLPYEYPVSYDADYPGGDANIEARKWVAESFFAHNPDGYDFIVVMADFPVSLGAYDDGGFVAGVYYSIQNDTTGIGIPLFDLSGEFGSRQLQGYIDLRGFEDWMDADGDLQIEDLLATWNHEIGHRWLAHCSFEDEHGQISDALLGRDGSHWSYLLDSEGSYMYGADWVASDAGSYVAMDVQSRYSDLDLYLMGVLAPHEVQPFTLLQNSEVDPTGIPRPGDVVTGTPQTITVDSIVAAEGRRVPAAADTPREHRVALIYLVEPGEVPDPETIGVLGRANDSWAREYFAKTRGRSVVSVTRPAVDHLSYALRPDLQRAIEWLAASTAGDGRWADHPATEVRDTAAATRALMAVGGHDDLADQGLDALEDMVPAAIEAEARRVEVLALAGRAAASQAAADLADGAEIDTRWGTGLRYRSDAVTTARVVRALEAAGLDGAIVSPWNALLGESDPTGWRWTPESTATAMPTAEVLAAGGRSELVWGRQEFQQALGSFIGAQHETGGFGRPHPNPLTTALFLESVSGRAVQPESVSLAIEYLARSQRSDGSWDGGVHTTATCVTALAGHLLPDLEVRSEELLVVPEEFFIGDDVDVMASVRAHLADSPVGVSYRWELQLADFTTVLARATLPSIGAELVEVVTDRVQIDWGLPPGDAILRIVVDDEDIVREGDELNNTAELPVVLTRRPDQADLVVDLDVLRATPESIAQIPQHLIISGSVSNVGFHDVVDVPLWVTDGAGGAVLGETTVTVGNLSSSPFVAAVTLVEARSHELEVVVDPSGAVADPTPGNNLGTLVVPLQHRHDPAVGAETIDVAPAGPLTTGDTMTLSTSIQNRGTLTVSSLTGRWSAIPSGGGEPIVIGWTELAIDVEPGQSHPVELEWQVSVADPSLEVRFELDPLQSVEDADRSNNLATAVVSVAAGTLPDLQVAADDLLVTPQPALQGDDADIVATVRNPSPNDAGAFRVEIRLDDPVEGRLIGNETIDQLAAGTSVEIAATWAVTTPTDQLVWVVVDPDDLVAEFNADNNQAFGVIDVSSLPDLVVSDAALGIDPALPFDGQETTVHLEIFNAGDQAVEDLRIDLVSTPGTGATTVMPRIEGGATGTVSFNWIAAAADGRADLEITVDPGNAVDELSELNNVARLGVPVQDADLWVSERFFSPNGDGIRDTTRIFVRNNVDAVTIEDYRGRIVRSYPEAGDVVVWDGRDDRGYLADDGVYTIATGAGETWCVIDLNRTRIVDDIHGEIITRSVNPIADEGRFVSGVFGHTEEQFFVVEETGSGSNRTSRILERTGGGVEILGELPQGFEYRLISVSRDGLRFIARQFVTGVGGVNQIVLVQFPGPVVRLGPSAEDISSRRSLSPDGQWVATLGIDSDSSPYDKSEQRGPQLTLTSFDDLSFEASIEELIPGATNPFGNSTWLGDGSILLMSLISGGNGHILWLEVPSLSVVRSTSFALGDSLSSAFQHLWTRFDVRDEVLTWARSGRGHPEVLEIDAVSGEVLNSQLPGYPGWEAFHDQCVDLSRTGRALRVYRCNIRPLKGSSTGKASHPPGKVLYDWATNDSANIGVGGSWSVDDISLTTLTGSVQHTSAANLIADLGVIPLFGNAGFEITLTVTDAQLSEYHLEYASASAPDSVVPIGLSDDQPRRAETWGAWIPPGPGSYLIRVVATDEAGNTATDEQWVTWTGVPDITGFWRDHHAISPLTSPGIQDALTWQYTVLHPVNLVFEIADEAGNTVRTIPVAAPDAGERATSWDGRNDAGAFVPDGLYVLRYNGAEWPVIVDSTPPEAFLDIESARRMPDAADVVRLEACGDSDWSALAENSIWGNIVNGYWSDTNEESIQFEFRAFGSSEWIPNSFPYGHPDASRRVIAAADQVANRDHRLVATDVAGNTTVVSVLVEEPRLGLIEAEPACRSVGDPCRWPNRPFVGDVEDGIGLVDPPTMVLDPYYDTMLVQAALTGLWQQSLVLEYRAQGGDGQPPGQWQSGEIELATEPVCHAGHLPRLDMECDGQAPRVPANPCRANRDFTGAQVYPLYWNHESLPLRRYDVRLRAFDAAGAEVASPIVEFVPAHPLALEYLGSDSEGDHFRITNLSSQPISDIELVGSVVETPGPGDGVLSLPVAELEPRQSRSFAVGCAFLGLSRPGSDEPDGWVRAVGRDPENQEQSSPPTPFERGHHVDVSRVETYFQPASCISGPVTPQGISLAASGQDFWAGDLRTPGRLAQLDVSVPALDPTGIPIVGYELLVDGIAVTEPDALIPGTTSSVVLDLSGLDSGWHMVTERYVFAAGADSVLDTCVQSATMLVDREPPQVSITNPPAEQVLCPSDGPATVGWVISDDDLLAATTCLSCETSDSCLNSFGSEWRLDGSEGDLALRACEPAMTSGTLGYEALVLDVPSVPEGSHALQIGVHDAAGNAACQSVVLTIGSDAEFVRFIADPNVFSPTNTTGGPIATTIEFESTAAAEWVSEIRRDGALINRSEGSLVPGEVIAQTWDGTDLGGEPVPDGVYTVSVSLSSSCGATVVEHREVVVDTTPPLIALFSPAEGNGYEAVVRFEGIIADRFLGDPTRDHMDRWLIEYRGPSDCEDCWNPIRDGGQSTDAPGTWSCGDLDRGYYTIAVSATDVAGNQSRVEIYIELTDAYLVRDFWVDKPLIAPGGAPEWDSTSATISLHRAARVTLTAGEGHLLLDQVHLEAGDHGPFEWDGRDGDGMLVPDGVHPLDLHAEDPSGFVEAEWYTIDIVTDTMPPDVVIHEPEDGSVGGLPVHVAAWTSDPHPDVHRVEVVGDSWSQELLSGEGNLPWNWTMDLRDVPDGEYLVRVEAADLLGNVGVLEHAFEIDQITPTIEVQTPDHGRTIDPELHPLVLEATYVASQAEVATWRIAAGWNPEPVEFTTLWTGTPDGSGLLYFNWVGPVPDDGRYTVEAEIVDRLGRAAVDGVRFTVDTVAPEARIDMPADGAEVFGPFVVEGVASDANLSTWSLTLIDEQTQQEDLVAAGTSTTSGTLAQIAELDPNTAYRLVLVVRDAAGHETEVQSTFSVVSLPPGPPALAAEVQNLRDVALSWVPGTGSPPVAYRLIRNGAVQADGLSQTSFNEYQLEEGTYVYSVVAIDAHGRESEPSNDAAVVINYLPPTVAILSPGDGASVAGSIPIWGTATSDGDFAFYEVWVKPTAGTTRLIAHETAPRVNQVLGNWMAVGDPWSDGSHRITVVAEDVFGNRAERSVSVTLDSLPPDPGPVALQVSVSANHGDGAANDALLTWVHEPLPDDAAGYYLYRNGQLANAPGPVVGDTTPFLLPGLTYLDDNVPDGTHSWMVIAADHAGNLSAPSNEAGPVVIDVHRPHAEIIEPAVGAQFEGSVLVRALCADEDVEGVVIQFRAQGDQVWQDLATIGLPPYEALFEPEDLGIHEIRALASDALGTDPSPQVIWVEHVDRVPDPPRDLEARVDQNDVTLTWQAPQGTDGLAGFVVYRDGAAIGPALLSASTTEFVEADADDGTYVYTVRCEDEAGRQSAASNEAEAVVVTPFFRFFDPLTGDGSLTVRGADVYPWATVAIRSNGEDVGQVQAASSGTFEATVLGLPIGFSHLTAQGFYVDDDRTNLSSSALVVHDPPPVAPSSLEASTSGLDVSLSWNLAEAESHTSYRIQRGASILDESEAPLAFDPSNHALEASSGDPATWTAVVDGDHGTGWTPAPGFSPVAPALWDWTFDGWYRISTLAIAIDAPHVFSLDVEYLVEDGWIRWSTHSVSTGQIHLAPDVVASGLRIRVNTALNCDGTPCAPTIQDVSVSQRSMPMASPYISAVPFVGYHSFTVAAMDRWGRLSEPASTRVFVGNGDPVEPPTDLVANALPCEGVALEWNAPDPMPSGSVDFVVYRASGLMAPVEIAATVAEALVDRSATPDSEWIYTVATRRRLGPDTHLSAPSTPASAEVQCDQAIPDPVIDDPTTADRPLQATEWLTPIGGTAMAGARVVLFHDGEDIDETITDDAVWEESVVELPSGADRPVLSSEGRYLGFEDGSSVVVRDLVTGEETQFETPVRISVDAVAPGGARVAGTWTDPSTSVASIGVWNVRDGALINGWPIEVGSRMAFSGDAQTLFWHDYTNQLIVVTDLETGQAFQSLPSPYLNGLHVDPSGRFVVWVNYDTLGIVDRSDGSTVEFAFDHEIEVGPGPFSPDGDQLVVIERIGGVPPSGGNRTWMIDVQSGESTEVLPARGFFTACFVDGQTIVGTTEGSIGTALQRLELSSGAPEVLVDPVEGGGSIAVIDSSTFVLPRYTSYALVRWIPPRFTFGDVELNEGWNQFFVRQEAAGFRDSEAIDIQLIAEDAPNFQATDLRVVPSVVVSGESVVVDATISNTSSSDEWTPGCRVTVRSPSGIEDVVFDDSVVVPPGDSVLRTIDFSVAEPGRYAVDLVVDSEDWISETDETDNELTGSLTVVTFAGSTLDVSVDRSVYSVGERLSGVVVFRTTEWPADWLLETTLVDHNGNPMAVLDSRLLPQFGPGEIALSVAAELDGVYPGSYAVRAAASAPDRETVEAMAGFGVVAPAFVTLEIQCDRTAYEAGESVRCDAAALNLGTAALADLTLAFELVDTSNDATIITADASVSNLIPGVEATIPWSWDSTGQSPMVVEATCRLMDAEGALLAQASPVFFTLTESGITVAGQLSFAPEIMDSGTDTELEWTVTNSSLVASLDGLENTLQIVGATDLVEVFQDSFTINLGAGASGQGSVVVSTVGWPTGLYVGILTASSGGLDAPVVLDTATLNLVDTTPPDVIVLEPIDGLSCDEVTIRASVHDGVGTVMRVDAAIDGSEAILGMARLNPGSDPNLWGATVPSGLLADGDHTLVLHAEDLAGNVTSTPPMAFSLDSQSPDVVITAPQVGVCTSDPVQLVFDAFDPGLSDIVANVDGSPVASGQVITPEGLHTLHVAATDVCAHESSQVVEFIIDVTVPAIAIVGVELGDELPPGSQISWSVVDANLVSSWATLDGLAVVSPLTVHATGSHLLEVGGVDCAGNQVTEGVSFTVDESTLVVGGGLQVQPTVLEPGNPVSVRGDTQNLGSDIGNATLTVEIVHVPTSTLLGSASSTGSLPAGAIMEVVHTFDTAGWSLGAYQVTLTLEGVFNGEPFTRMISSVPLELVDLTPPEVSVFSPPELACDAPVVSVQAQDVLGAVAQVEARVDDGPEVSLILGSDGLWSSVVETTDGEHGVVVTATDDSGNAAQTTPRVFTVDTMPPVITLEAPAPGVCVGEPVAVRLTAEDPHLDAVRLVVDGTVVANEVELSDDGEHVVAAEAVDACGRSADEETVFTIDRTDPVIHVLGVTDGATITEPVQLTWSVAEVNLVSQTARLDGQPVVPPVTVDDPGAHLLEVSAEDCAGHEVTERRSFTLALPEPEPMAVAEVDVAACSALVYDRSPVLGDEVAERVASHCSHVVLVRTATEALRELRSGLYDIVVIYQPVDAAPVEPASDESAATCADLGREMLAASIRRGGVVILGGGALNDGCLLDALTDAALVLAGDAPIDAVPRATTEILVPTSDEPLAEARSITAVQGTALLDEEEAPRDECSAIASLTLEWIPDVSSGPWTVHAALHHPLEPTVVHMAEMKDGDTSGSTDFGDTRCVLRRVGNRLQYTIEQRDGAGMDWWTGVDLTVVDELDAERQAGAWFSPTCDFTVGDAVSDDLIITDIGRVEVGGAVTASVTTAGMGRIMVLPWDVMDPLNGHHVELVDQAVVATLPDADWPWIVGFATPIHVRLGIEDAAAASRFQIEVDDAAIRAANPRLTGESPVTWETWLEPGDEVSLTLWLVPRTAGVLHLPWSVGHRVDGDWINDASGVFSQQVQDFDMEGELQHIAAELQACAVAGGPDLVTRLRPVIQGVDALATMTQRGDSVDAILSRAATTLSLGAEESAPCVAALRYRLAVLIAGWQQMWWEDLELEAPVPPGVDPAQSMGDREMAR